MGKKKTSLSKSGHQNVRQRITPTEGQEEENGTPVVKIRKHPMRRRKSSEAAPPGLDKFGLLIGILIMTITPTLVYYFWYQNMLRERIHQPFEGALVVPKNGTSAAVDPERFWGTYRPGTYFGLKTRSPRSVVTGLMWFTQGVVQGAPPIRHWCEQGDNLYRYGWTHHDGRSFGRQEIVDRNFVILTDFVKRPGGDHGGDWTAKFSVLPQVQDNSSVFVSLMFYAALDGQGELDYRTEKGRLTTILGRTEELGEFKIEFPKSTSNLKASNYLVTQASGLDKLNDAVLRGMTMKQWKERFPPSYVALGGQVLPKDGDARPNFIMHQVTVSLPFTMEVQFLSGSVRDRPKPLIGEEFDKLFGEKVSAFTGKFNQLFALEQKGYQREEIIMARAALSNMIGGVGYFYGQSAVQSKYNKEPVPYWAAPLYSGVPSRSFFPRGFLWDEGFHNILIRTWDQEISMDIVGHWLDLMNVDGWIPREQILGAEARAKVPAEFVVQKNENANPPTLFLPLQHIVKDLINSAKPRDKMYLKNIFPRLKRWFNWFNTTQIGVAPFTYHWRGRNPDAFKELNPKTLTSGLDDYPRASHPTADERHLDLRCWMALASGVMTDIAKTLGESSDDYESTHRYLTDNDLLNTLHWSPKTKMYADWGLHTDNCKLKRPPPPQPKPGQRPPPQQQDKIRYVVEEPKYRFIDSFGYVSLFPLLLKIIEPTSEKLGIILQDMRDQNLLWTSYGLRSIARNSKFYNRYNTEHDPPYWRGAIWINVNYLACSALHHYAHTTGPHQEVARNLYTDLRRNLVQNILKNYRQTGYIWEQYDDKTGQGKGCHPFTGWSALVVAIMAEKY